MVKIVSHSDADGIISGYFLSFVVKDPKLEIWDGRFGSTTGMKKGDYMTDMRPIENLEGITVYDHHLPHREDRKYTLISDDVPASLIVWNKHKEDIPKSEWWKLAIGLLGDGQPELIPSEVFEACPQLLTKVKTSTYQNYGKWNIGYYPVYKLLSSYVNALLRLKHYEDAINLVTYSQNPMNIINSAKARACKAEVKRIYEDIIKSSESYDFEDLVVFIFDCEFRMAGYLASSLQNSVDNKTIMAINRKDGTGSVRGDLAYYWKDKLKHLEYLQIDGHPGFCYDKETRVLTKEGFKYFKDVKLTDDVMTMNPETKELEYLKPEKKIQFEYEGDMIHFKGERNIDLKVTPNHSMPCIMEMDYKRGDRNIIFREAKDITKWDAIPTGGGIWNCYNNNTIKIGEKSYSTEWFSKFMGMFLAEGWVSRMSNNYYRISIAQSKVANKDVCDKIEELLKVYNFTYSNSKSTYNFADKNLGEYLYSTKKRCHEKSIPKEIKDLTPKYLNMFLEYFRLGDGSKRERLYYTSSKDLAEDLCELILKCNRKPNIRTRDDIGRPMDIKGKHYKTKHLSYDVYDNSRTFGRFQGKDKHITKYKDMVYCLRMPRNHTLYVERNGSMMWCGNCGLNISCNPEVLIEDIINMQK